MIQTRDGRLYRVEPVLIGEIIEDNDPRYGIANAFQRAKEKKLQPATAPQGLDLRIACENFEDPLWQSGFHTLSGSYTIGKNVFVAHGRNHPLAYHKRMRRAIKKGLINYAAKLAPAEIQRFRDGRMKGGNQIAYEDLLKRKVPPGPFVVRAERALFKRLPNDYLPLTKWSKDPRAIIFSGSRERAEQYAEKLGKKGVKKAWLSLDVEDGIPDRGRVLFLGDDNLGLKYDFYYYGRVVGVAPEAHVAKNSSLEARTA